ncbi:PhzF family phenazine biosynthesis protein [Sphingomicrobium aestuariivivum]|uniref:PhzF family phenazine biosynthesis protein n=1 Tax=Sphingomicrobium aestuariivivum TaxID=1582356 RepID=UPI001FD6C6F6|nr:PhzF family phenazine biosynthesis protein [Sphingomicrobium aestuariivivum]MCJ8191536.1 PhzF family phenazine biosynthesis protein [Sphingomicrobium aestuariivivum]
MPTLPFTQVDAFTVGGAALTGNPAAVMPLEGDWFDDATLLAIAVENNLSETAFTLPCADDDADYDLRWFTPGCEVAMCGHATLASAHVLIGEADRIRFRTRKAGIITVTRDGNRLVLDMPFATASKDPRAAQALAAVGSGGEAHFYAGVEPIVIIPLADEAAVRACTPDFGVLKTVEALVIVTAPGNRTDFASRVFAGAYGIDEDPVTGAAHMGLAPYWADRLGKQRMSAHQASTRGGDLSCAITGDRLHLGGEARTVIRGKFSF